MATYSPNLVIWGMGVTILLVIHSQLFLSRPGGRLNKKDGLTRYGDSHVKDKTS